MKLAPHFLILIGFLASINGFGQEFFLKPGELQVIAPNDKFSQPYQLYIPSDYDPDGFAPIMIILGNNDPGEVPFGSWAQSAEQAGIVLLQPLNLYKEKPLNENITAATTAIEEAKKNFGKPPYRIFVGGSGVLGNIATTLPLIVDNIQGVFTVNSIFPIAEMNFKNKKPFYINMVNKNHYSMVDAMADEEILNQLKVDNALIFYTRNTPEASSLHLNKGFRLLLAKNMLEGELTLDSVNIKKWYQESLKDFHWLKDQGQLTTAYDYLSEIFEVYKNFGYEEQLNTILKELRKDGEYKTRRREENNLVFQEKLIREDFAFSMSEDIETVNYKNLGWWKYQLDQIRKMQNIKSVHNQMGHRLGGYLTALANDNLNDIRMLGKEGTEEELWIHMLNTLLEPQNEKHFLSVISLSTQMEDLGTALFYTEELLKKGFSDKDKFYTLEGAALLRISPEFNALMEKYIGNSLYPNIIEE